MAKVQCGVLVAGLKGAELNDRRLATRMLLVTARLPGQKMPYSPLSRG